MSDRGIWYMMWMWCINMSMNKRKRRDQLERNGCLKQPDQKSPETNLLLTDHCRSSASSTGWHGDLDRHPRLHRPGWNTHLPGCTGVWAKPPGRSRRRWPAPSPGRSPCLSWRRSYEHPQHPPRTRSNSLTWKPITGPPWLSPGRAPPPGSTCRAPDHLGGRGRGGLEETLLQALAVALQLLQHHFGQEVRGQERYPALIHCRRNLDLFFTRGVMKVRRNFKLKNKIRRRIYNWIFSLQPSLLTNVHCKTTAGSVISSFTYCLSTCFRYISILPVIPVTVHLSPQEAIETRHPQDTRHPPPPIPKVAADLQTDLTLYKLVLKQQHTHTRVSTSFKELMYMTQHQKAKKSNALTTVVVSESRCCVNLLKHLE